MRRKWQQNRRWQRPGENRGHNVRLGSRGGRGKTNFVEICGADGDELDCIAALDGGERVAGVNGTNECVFALHMKSYVRCEREGQGGKGTLMAITSVMGDTFMDTARRGMTLLMAEVVAPTT
jgi:hypothetical protein